MHKVILEVILSDISLKFINTEDESNYFVNVLKNLQEEMDKQESSLRKFGSVTHQLLTECHPSVAETLNRALRDVNIRYG